MRLAVRGLTFDVHLGGPPDGPPVLLLHGFPQHSGEWELVALRLHAAGVHTIAVDQRGYSSDARPEEPSAYRLSEFVADSVAVLDELGHARAYVVGHDVGAMVGWHLAGYHPERVRALVAISAPHPAAMAAALAGDAEQRQRSSYIALFRQPGQAEQVLLAEDARRLRAMLAGVPPERIEQYVAPMREPAALTAALNWYRALALAELGSCPPAAVPTTYLWSDQDPAIGRAAAHGCGEYVREDYRFVELAGVSHWLPEEAPSAVADAILRRTSP